MKKLLCAVLCATAVSTGSVLSFSFGGTPKQLEEQSEAIGKGFVKGISKEGVDLKVFSNAGNDFERTFQEGKGFDHGLSKAVKLLGKHFNAAGSELADAMKEGGEVDQGLSNTAARISGFRDSIGITAVGKWAEGITDSFNKDNFQWYATRVVVAGTAYFVAKYGVPLVMDYVRMGLFKPQVIIDSNTGLKSRIKRAVFGPDKRELSKMIVDASLEQRLEGLVQSTLKINQAIRAGNKKATYRNVMLYGPPGTGKTMFARQLAHKSGMFYAEVTGSSFFQPGAGIKAIDELFKWANSGKGLLLFIDEADSLFPDRDVLRPEDQERIQIVNHFLNYLGTESNKFMVVVATNRSLAMDDAIDRRFPDKVEMALPSVESRHRLLMHNRDKILLDASQSEAFRKSVNQVLTDKKLKEVAELTNGLSNGHLYYLVDEMQHRVITAPNGLLTSAIVDSVVNDQVAYYKKRQAAQFKKLGIQQVPNENLADALPAVAA